MRCQKSSTINYSLLAPTERHAPSQELRKKQGQNPQSGTQMKMKEQELVMFAHRRQLNSMQGKGINGYSIFSSPRSSLIKLEYDRVFSLYKTPSESRIFFLEMIQMAFGFLIVYDKMKELHRSELIIH